MGFRIKNTRSVEVDYAGYRLRIGYKIASLDGALSLQATQIDYAEALKKGPESEDCRAAHRSMVEFAAGFALSIHGREIDDEGNESWPELDIGDDEGGEKKWSQASKAERAAFLAEHFALATAFISRIVPTVTEATKKK